MRICSLSAVAILFALLLPASSLEAQGATSYTLDPAESYFSSGCGGPSPCLCPVLLGSSLGGSFSLVPVPLSLGPIFEYTVEDFSVVTLSPANGSITQYTGSGLYVVNLAAQTQRMTLNLEANGVPQFFETIGDVPLSGDFNDQIAISVFHQVNACFFDGLSMVANAVSATEFIRGDANQDGNLNIADAIQALVLLFGSTPDITCAKSLDTNDDGTPNIADPIYLLNHLFANGAPPSSPFPDCGPDPTGDNMGCNEHTACP